MAWYEQFEVIKVFKQVIYGDIFRQTVVQFVECTSRGSKCRDFGTYWRHCVVSLSNVGKPPDITGKLMTGT